MVVLLVVVDLLTCFVILKSRRHKSHVFVRCTLKWVKFCEGVDSLGPASPLFRSATCRPNPSKISKYRHFRNLF
ncbi:hypothetical protein EDB81DRAFT_806055 [Dactylonectria macrodidyma]|uniref:Secreted protein n=1 Tax=Dactylonectria macrodidyma TaxID=307937 RepID=A0A9P9ITF5_9HYPO|nr:hypothetical protein EDB81DRAFT_806055 [Dactylonectria macrodidyma]